MQRYDVLVSGVVSVDVIFSSIPKLPDLGEEVYCGDFEFTCGAAYNTAVALSRLGLKVAIAAPIGNDFLSKFILESLESEKVSTEYMKHFNHPLRTLSVALNYGGDRSFISYEDEVADFDYANYINSVMERADTKVLHISAGEENQSAIKIAKEKGIDVSLDVGWSESWLTHPKLKEIIKMGDYFTPNLKEARLITGEENPEKALEKLSEINPDNTIIIKLGEKGALYKSKENIVHIPGFKRRAIDTTGAGDVFVSGVLTGLLKGFGMKKAVRLGNFCGGCSVEGMGGTKNSPYWSEVPKEFL